MKTALQSDTRYLLSADPHAEGLPVPSTLAIEAVDVDCTKCAGTGKAWVAEAQQRWLAWTDGLKGRAAYDAFTDLWRAHMGGNVTQTCLEATAVLVALCPELERVRGQVRMTDPPDGDTRLWPHWWCVTGEGEVVDLDERSWLPRHHRGDASAFGELLRAYQAPIWSYLGRCGVRVGAYTALESGDVLPRAAADRIRALLAP